MERLKYNLSIVGGATKGNTVVYAGKLQARVLLSSNLDKGEVMLNPCLEEQLEQHKGLPRQS